MTVRVWKARAVPMLPVVEVPLAGSKSVVSDRTWTLGGAGAVQSSRDQDMAVVEQDGAIVLAGAGTVVLPHLPRQAKGAHRWAPPRGATSGPTPPILFCGAVAVRRSCLHPRLGIGKEAAGLPARPCGVDTAAPGLYDTGVALRRRPIVHREMAFRAMECS